MAVCELCQAELTRRGEWPPEYDPKTFQLTVCGEQRKVTPTVASVLRVLWQRRGQCVSEETLAALVWNGRPPGSLSGIRQHVYLLRQVLNGGRDEIVTNRNRGWTFRYRDNERRAA